jgi:pimeloyl-ACP methyl ester carboxylesterase
MIKYPIYLGNGDKKMDRHFFQHNGYKLSYLDSGGEGQLLIALHAHWMEGATFEPLAAALAPFWRVIALDQRGHGYSDHPQTYTRDDYLGDLSALFQHLKIKEPLVLLGNSLGGVNAYQFAARHPELVKAMIIEDIGVEIEVDVNFSLAWAGTFKTKEELAQNVGPRFAPYLEDSFRHTETGWRLAFNPSDMVTSNKLVAGNHWQDWLASDCPALLIRGKDSRLTTQAHFEEMAKQRLNTTLCTLEGGHVVHIDNFKGFMEQVNKFLYKLHG